MDYNDADDLRKYQGEQAEETEAHNCPSISPHGDVCTLTRGHEDQHERHSAGERLASWADGAPQLCGDSSAVGGWGPGATCKLEIGHEGHHADGPIRWGPDPLGARPLVAQAADTPEAAYAAPEEALRARLAAHRPQILPPIEHAVRVRFIELPSLPANPKLRVRFIELPSLPANPKLRESHPMHGLLSGVMRPGGFALVVDRFRHVAHLEGERGLWDGFGAKIGAVHVLLYVGTLDTDDLMDQ